ncbi:MAG: metal ABC transporter substrate-binding protein [Mycoplasmatales bacterium]
MRKNLLIIMILSLIILTGCTTKQADNTKPTIMTTVYPVKYMTEVIVGDTMNVQSVYPNGADIHDYELTTNDIQKVLEADYLFAISDNMEAFLPTIEESVTKDESKVQVLKIADEKLMTDQIKDEQYHNQTDNVLENYHFWTSPKKALIMSEIIYNKLIEDFPENKELYTTNYEWLEDQLKQLDEQYAAVETNKIFYVTHDAYYWIAQDYEIDIRGVQGDDHHHEPSSKELQEIVDTINEQGILTVYAERDDEENKLIKTISEQTGAEIKYLNNFELELDNEDYLAGLTNNLKEFKS